MKVYCIAYAGSSASFFKKWNTTEELENELTFIPLEYSGRGLFANKDLIESFDDSLLFLYEQIKDSVDDDFFLFGHSLGAYFAFELTKKLYAENRNLPKRLFLSAAKPPNLKEKYKLENDSDLRALLIEYGATPPEVLNDPDIFTYFKPIIRNDFLVFNDYVCSNKGRLPVETRVLFGTEDTIDSEEIRDWEPFFQKKITYSLIEGDHFFIDSNSQSIINIINRDRIELNGQLVCK